MAESPDILTLCATELQARLLREQQQAERAGSAQQVWESPRILSLQRWARETWLTTWPGEELISRSKELWLWERLLAQSPSGQALLAPTPLARQLRQSWELCQQWNIDPQDAPRWTPEQDLFAELHQAFAVELQQRGWITDSQIPWQLVQQPLPNPVPVQLYGLDDSALGPRDRALICRLEQDWPEIRPWRPQINGGVDGREARLCTSTTEQWSDIAQALEDLLRLQPDASVVIAVADLARQRSNIESHWLARLAPWVLADDDPAPAPWMIEQAQPLLEQPLVQAWLDGVELQAANMPFPLPAAILRQALLFSPAERIWTCAAEEKLRAAGVLFSADDLHQALPEDAEASLRDRLQALATIVGQAPRQANAEDWVRHWRARWVALDPPPNEQHWSLLEELDQALLEFISLGDQLGTIGPQTALHWLRQILAERHYSPRRRHGHQITICDLRAAADLPCTHLFVVGLDKQHCPAPRRPNIWINPEQQIQAGIPEADPDSHLEQQTQQLRMLLRNPAATTIWCSTQDPGGIPLTPTQLVPLNWQRIPEQMPQPSRGLAWRDQDGVPAMQPKRLAQQGGGASILRLQARSGFLAFVQHRLSARELEPVPEGLSARVQGQWVHELLALFWAECQDSRTLASLADQALSERLTEYVQKSQWRYLPAPRFGAALRQLEADRVQRLCLRWLQHERKRIDPFVVLHREVPLEDNRMGLPIKMRIDRVDRCDTPDGERFLIIDYKTGVADHRGWKSERLLEPQLPLYATSTALTALGIRQADGICFARLHEQQPALVAATNWRPRLIEDDNQPAPADWAQQIAGWTGELEQLARAFIDGDIRLDPGLNLSADFSARAAAFLIDQPTPEDADAR